MTPNATFNGRQSLRADLSYLIQTSSKPVSTTGAKIRISRPTKGKFQSSPQATANFLRSSEPQLGTEVPSCKWKTWTPTGQAFHFLRISFPAKGQGRDRSCWN